MSSPSCPPWLQVAVKSYSHLNSVLSTLSKRETQREKARAVSRHSSARTSRRTPHILATLNSQTDAPLEYSVSVGSQPRNQSANRYIELEPFDRTRVVVGGESEAPGEGRYLNANWVRELHEGKWWIATQAPLPNTVHAFLSILLQPRTTPPTSISPSVSATASPSRVRTVVQLTLAHEGGRLKAHPYFPSQVGQGYIVPPEDGCDAPPLEITLVESKQIEEAMCVQSTVHLTYHTAPDPPSGDGVTFQHLLYTAWPDHGVPSPADRMSLLRFLQLVARVNRETSTSLPLSDTGTQSDVDPDPPIMVGCSAGIGRTGAFIALCSLLRAHGLLLPEHNDVEIESDQSVPPLPASPLGPLPEDVAADKVAAEIDSLREQRGGMVQREEQVLLIYELLQDAFMQRSGSEV